MAGNRIFIELIEGKNKNGTLKKKKYFIKPLMTMFDTFQAMKLASSLQKMSTESENGEVPIEEFEEVFQFIVEQFDNQFTVEELMKGLPSGEKGFSIAGDVLMKVANANQESDTKTFLEEKKN